MSKCERCEKDSWYHSNEHELCRDHFVDYQFKLKEDEIAHLELENKKLKEAQVTPAMVREAVYRASHAYIDGEKHVAEVVVKELFGDKDEN